MQLGLKYFLTYNPISFIVYKTNDGKLNVNPDNVFISMKA